MHLPPPYNLATDIAVIAAAARFPGAADLHAFWANIVAGVAAVKSFSEEELRAAGVDAQTCRQEAYVARGVLLEDRDRFDAAFFGFTPREAEIMNPEQRLLLQCAQHALEDGGYDSQRCPDRIGTFVGVSGGHYLHENIMGRPDLLQRVGAKAVQLGNDPTFAATHLAYRLHLRGPALAVHCACSTSLVAVHLACRSLLDFECDMALAGGSHLSGSHGKGYLYREGGIHARDGVCRPFDAAASGTISGSGVGVVLLKRLEDALAAGDRIIAVVKGTAVNNDGADKVGFSAPSVNGQCEVISSALEQSEVHAEWIGYHEAHGTGTVLGDPIEIAAATAAHRRHTQASGYCALGALKANVGHMATAAGIGGFIKTCLVLAHRTIPPLSHFTAPNPALQLATTPFRIPAAAEPWRCDVRPRFASVSAFGMGGTNAHAVLCEAPAVTVQPSTRSWHVWPMSATSVEALAAMKERLRAAAETLSAPERADAAFTLSVGRRQLAERDYLLVPESGPACQGAAQRAANLSAANLSVAMLFPGQGAQYPGMAAANYAQEPAYRDVVDACLQRLTGRIDFDLRELLLNPQADEQRLRATDAAQCALFVTSYATAALWRDWGLVPAALLGHSIGEYVAACLAEVMTLETALELVVLRGQVMREAPRGAMLAVSASEQQLRMLPAEHGEIEIAAVNAPRACVLAGTESHIRAMAAALRGHGIAATQLHTSHAFHSRSMAHASTAFAARIAPLVANLSEPRIPYVSNLSGDWITGEQVRNPQYWADQMRSCVRFAAGIERLLHKGIQALLEVGPGQSISRMLRTEPQWRGPLIAASSRHVRGPQTDAQVLAESCAVLWSHGVALQLERRYRHERRQRVALPLTAFAPQRHWITPVSQSQAGMGGLAEEPAGSVDDWFYVPAWRRQGQPLQPDGQAHAHWILVGPSDTMLAALAERVAAAGGQVSYLEPADVTDTKCAALAEQARTAATAVRIVYGMPLTARVPTLPHTELVEYLQFLQSARSLLLLENAVLLCVTRAGASIAGEALEPSRAMLGAATRVVAQEFAALRAVWIDIDAAPPAAIANQVLAEIHARALAVALRNRQRWVTDCIPTQPCSQVPDLNLRSSGCYLITGGLGGMGLAVAEHFASKCAVKLVLIGRTGLPPREQWPELVVGTEHAADCMRRIQAIERSGSEVLVAAADVADETAMSAVIGSMQQRFGPCHGVIHAAGVVAGALLVRQSQQKILEALAPKVMGLHVLQRLLPAPPLDFVLLCSSQNALKGGIGRFGYAAANAYLDAYAQLRAAQDARVVVRSVNWGAWAQTGMAVRHGTPSAHRRQQMFLTAESLSVLDRVLAGDEARLAISKVPLNELLASAEDQQLELQDAPASVQPQSRPRQVQAAFVEPSGEHEVQIAAILADVLGIAPIGADDDFFELGGNSLMMIQVGARIQDRFKIEFTAQDLFAAVTVRQLAARVAPSQDETLAKLSTMLASLSTEDLDEVLSQYAEES